MTVQEIKNAVDAGFPVRWQNERYHVVADGRGDYVIRFDAPHGHIIGLTWADGQTLNGKPEDFFVLNEDLRMIRLDNGDEVSLDEFLSDNAAVDVEPLPTQYIERLRALEIGEQTVLEYGAGGRTVVRRTR